MNSTGKGIIRTAGLFLILSLPAWATFSIVAVDIQTGEVGSAGASCLQGSLNQSVFIISDVLPGRGAVHTQASWNATNKQRAYGRLVAGDSPQQIMVYMQQNDAQNNPSIRQYGAVDLYQGAARSAGFTGANCGNWKGHRTGPVYAIQGNILAYQHDSSQGGRVLDSMQARFLATPGTLADRLMAALQGGKKRGADDRCWNEGVSSQSSFLRVARTGDSPAALYLDLRVPSRPTGMDPIDSLQTLYDRWKNTVALTPARRNRDVKAILRRGRWILETGAAIQGPAVLTVFRPSGELGFRGVSLVERGRAIWPVPTGLGSGFHLIQIRGPDFLWSGTYSRD